MIESVEDRQGYGDRKLSRKYRRKAQLLLDNWWGVE
jgi:hypothetical protein